jgi:hypothetical protein
MPKEAFKTGTDEKLVVGWSKSNEFVELGLGIGIPFVLLESVKVGDVASIEEDLFYTFDNEKELTKFIRALMRARKQAFGKKK